MKKQTPPKAKPRTWRDDVRPFVEELTKDSPALCRQSLQLLENPLTEDAGKALHKCQKEGVDCFQFAVAVIGAASYANPADIEFPSKNRSADVAAALRTARRCFPFDLLCPGSDVAVERAADFFQSITDNHAGGRPKKIGTIYFLSEKVRQAAGGKPCHKATALLLQAALPAEKWSAGRVRVELNKIRGTIIDRLKPLTKPPQQTDGFVNAST